MLNVTEQVFPDQARISSRSKWHTCIMLIEIKRNNAGHENPALEIRSCTSDDEVVADEQRIIQNDEEPEVQLNDQQKKIRDRLNNLRADLNAEKLPALKSVLRAKK